jgi:formylmethanofuran dehydrogenase subunit E-like metal-binding protein
MKICDECESVNAASAKVLYQAALDNHPQAGCIYIISDKGRYYRNRTLTQWPEGTENKQIFLPAYSPDPNLTERWWRFPGKKVINTGFHRTQELFRKAVMNFFGNIADYRLELDTLPTLNFRLVNSHSISF